MQYTIALPFRNSDRPSTNKEAAYALQTKWKVRLEFLKHYIKHMWLVALPNPYKIEQSWECIFLKHYSHVNTKWALKKNSINSLLSNCNFKIFT